jgi:hypothetical protein
MQYIFRTKINLRKKFNVDLIKNYYYIFSNLFYSMAPKMVRWDPYLEPALFIIYRSPGSRSVIRNYGSVKLLSLDVVSQGKIPVGAFVLRTVVHFEEGC